MSRLEMLTLLYSLRALLKKGLYDDAMEVIESVILEAEKIPKKGE